MLLKMMKFVISPCQYIIEETSMYNKLDVSFVAEPIITAVPKSVIASSASIPLRSLL